jgi:3-methyladenine DNA glycosylase AlkD
VTTDLVRTLTDTLGDAFAANADVDKAAGARAYMRDQFPFYGIPSPMQKTIARAVTSGLRDPTESELARLAAVCWRKPEREWQYFGCGYLRRHVRGRTPAPLSKVQPLIVSKSWWDTIDSLASHTVGTLVREHPVLVTTMDEWVRSENFWLARTAILHQLGSKNVTDAGRLFDYCLLRASDGEFFVRKAIGWALREYSKTDEAAVRGFVAENADRLAPLSRKEALKWLERRA